MVNKRNVEDLSVEELERVLAIKRRQQRQSRLKRMQQSGRVIATGNEHPAAEQAAVSGQAQPPKRKGAPQFEDDIDEREFKTRSAGGRIWRMFLDRSLLIVEGLAVVGLIVLGVALFNGLNVLEEETAAAQQAAAEQRLAGIPTIAPTPQLTLANVVLPTGHTIQNGQAVFNFGEIPENMRGLVVNQVYLPPDVARPPATDDTPLRVVIPALNIDSPIVQGVDWDALKQGVGMLPNGSTPRSDRDNVVLAAHNDIYGEIFRHLDQLQVGDQYQIQTRSGIYTYRVREQQIVDPQDVWVMDSQGTAMSTLISCYPPNQNHKRIIIFADRVDA